MVENLRKMQELRAQIQAQLKLADTLKKLNENAGYENPRKYKQGCLSQHHHKNPQSTKLPQESRCRVTGICLLL